MEINKRFKEIMCKNEKILYIPLVSMRSYETNQYDLTCDGNVNRFISNFLQLSNTSFYGLITIVLPTNITSGSWEFLERFQSMFNTDTKRKVEFLFNTDFPTGGPKEERSLSLTINIVSRIKEIIDDWNPDLIIYEANYVGVWLEYNKHIELIPYKTLYWCPVSATIDVKPSFLTSVESIDKELAKSCDYMMVATQSQKEYFDQFIDDKETVFVNETLIDPSLDMFKFEKDLDVLESIKEYEEQGYKIVYFPFRMTDPGYKLSIVYSIIWNLVLKGQKILFVYVDPNDSKVFDEIYNISPDNIKDGIVPLKVSSSRDTYYTILSQSNCIVFYFEDVKTIMHASWQEMKYYNVDLVIDYEDTSSNIASNLISKWESR